MLWLTASAWCLIAQCTAAAADSPKPAHSSGDARAQLESKREQLAQRIKRLNATPRSSARSSQPAESAAELELLQSLELIYQSHLAALDETAEFHRERDLLKSEQPKDGDRPAAVGDSESWSALEDIRDELDAENIRLKTCGHEVSVARNALESARERQDHAARTRRRLREEATSGAQGPTAEVEERLRLATLEASLADATVDMRRAELARHEAKQELSQLRCQSLEAKVQSMAARVQFSDDDLQQRIRGLANYETEMRKRLDEARLRLQEIDDVLQQAHAATDKSDDGAASPGDGPTLETLRFIRSLRLEEVEQIQRWLTEVVTARNVPTMRYRLARNEVEQEDVVAWLGTIDHLMVMLADEEELLTSRAAEVMQELATIYRKNRLRGGGAPDADQEACQAALERLVQVMQSGQLHVRMLRRSGERFQRELREHVPDQGGPWGLLSLRDTWANGWNYELATVGDRPITVGKVVKGLLGLFVGIFLASIVSRQLGRRVFPRLGLNAGASAALRSLTFYGLSASFGVLSLELANVPLTALTFLGGATAIAVGFASQDIVSNFMSGVILLAEQPIRVGDFVELGGVRGTVERIGTRSTRVRTDANVEITVPNQKLLGDNVSNLTLSDNYVWSSVAISVDRGFPVADIKACLLESVQSHPSVTTHHPPYVLFTEFGETMLKFEVRFLLAMENMTDSRRIESDVRETIDVNLRKAGLICDTDHLVTLSAVERMMDLLGPSQGRTRRSAA